MNNFEERRVHLQNIKLPEPGTLDNSSDESEKDKRNKCKSAAVLLGQRRKLHPLLLGPLPGFNKDLQQRFKMQNASKSNLSEFTQRVMSAKLLKTKQLQNELNETNLQLNELLNENRLLKTLQKRQETALKRYEGGQAELPKLIKSHNEELRTLKTFNKAIKGQLRETMAKLKEKENELDILKENYNKLKKLSMEKHLMERDKLHRKVEDLKDQIKEQEERIQMLSRKLMLESKSFRHQLQIEMVKHKETQRNLHNALETITKLENQLLIRDKIVLLTTSNNCKKSNTKFLDKNKLNNDEVIKILNDNDAEKMSKKEDEEKENNEQVELVQVQDNDVTTDMNNETDRDKSDIKQQVLNKNSSVSSYSDSFDNSTDCVKSEESSDVDTDENKLIKITERETDNIVSESELESLSSGGDSNNKTQSVGKVEVIVKSTSAPLPDQNILPNMSSLPGTIIQPKIENKDNLILQELDKTDAIFKKLKVEKCQEHSVKLKNRNQQRAKTTGIRTKRLSIDSQVENETYINLDYKRNIIEIETKKERIMNFEIDMNADNIKTSNVNIKEYNSDECLSSEDNVNNITNIKRKMFMNHGKKNKIDDQVTNNKNDFIQELFGTPGHRQDATDCFELSTN